MISKKEVKHIAKLARLGLTEKEIEKFQKELSAILDYFAFLKEVDILKTELPKEAKVLFAVEPTSHPLEIENVMREDEAKEKKLEIRKKLVEMAPEKKKGYLKTESIL